MRATLIAPGTFSALLLTTTILHTRGIALGADYSVEDRPHATIRYRGMSRECPEALARIVSTLHEAYVGELGFNLPDDIVVTLDTEARQFALLYTTAEGEIVLRIPSAQYLRGAKRSGIDPIYGLAREIGRMAMLRLTKAQPWMTLAASEGWTHYIGSVMVDKVFGDLGTRAWPVEYDYLADGTRRLETQLSSSPKTPTVQGAGLWQQLAKKLPRRGMAGFFRAIGEGPIDPNDPTPGIQKALRLASPDSAVLSWWQKAAPLFVEPRRSGGTSPEIVDPRFLEGLRVTLRYGDNRGDGQEDLANASYAVRYEAPSGRWFMTGVCFLGNRYGSLLTVQPPATISLLNEQMKVIAEFKGVFSFVRRSDPQWVRMMVPPTRVPQRFAICVDFHGSRDQGIGMQYDRASEGHSLIGLPAKGFTPRDRGDWMIQLELGRTAETDPLADPKTWLPTTQPAKVKR
jgi:hypothetical protein